VALLLLQVLVVVVVVVLDTPAHVVVVTNSSTIIHAFDDATEAKEILQRLFDGIAQNENCSHCRVIVNI
jgi:hypothetical protein